MDKKQPITSRSHFVSLNIAFIKAKLCLDADNWTKQAEARDKDGNIVFLEDPCACQFCAYASVIRHLQAFCSVEDIIYVRTLLDRASWSLSMGRFPQVFAFNDDEESDLTDIRKLLSLAMSYLEEDAKVYLPQRHDMSCVMTRADIGEEWERALVSIAIKENLDINRTADRVI